MSTARGNFIGAKLRKLLDPRAVLKAASHPGLVLDSARQALFDVALKEENPAEMARRHTRALKSLAAFAAPLPVSSIASAFGDRASEEDAVTLAGLFRLHGSDKSTSHDYHLVYASLLRGRRMAPLRILEIGLGTNNIDVPSNMGPGGKPGASLRGFRDWAPHAAIVGADVDRRVLFAEERISTHFADQTKPETLAALASLFPPASFDLLIDDGLHTPEANLNFLRFALPLMKPDAAVVIEDVDHDTHPFWQIVATLLPRYRLRFVEAKSACVVVVQSSAA